MRRWIGVLLYDAPAFEMRLRSWGRFARHSSPWTLIRNRAETIEDNGSGVRCLWQDTSEIHIANVWPSAGRRLMHSAFAQWPVRLEASPSPALEPTRVSFIIGHRGRSRLPHLLMTLRSIAGQSVPVECIVVEQSLEPEIREDLPTWVRYLHTPIPYAGFEYARSWTLNAGATVALGEVLIFHDNDMVVPRDYAAEALRRVGDGWDFLDLKRFTFYLTDGDFRGVLSSGTLPTDLSSTVVQNARGASIVAAREAYFAIGGFDESFVGWGGEDNEFWERAVVGGRVYDFGYLPFVHLYHAPQIGKLQGSSAPAVKRYQEVSAIPPLERIEALRSRSFGRSDRPSAG